MPPKQQCVCVAGSGPQTRRLLLCCMARERSSSQTVPGSTRAQRSRVLISSTPCMYLDQSITMAALHVWPGMLVPPARDNSGAPNRRQAVTAFITSSFERGITTPRSEEHTSELQSRQYLVCRLLLEKKKK